jgi:amino acid permease
MDWTLVFDETGEEDLIIPALMEECPTETRLVRLLNKLYANDDLSEITDHRLFLLSLSERGAAHPYSLKALYFFTINYILGVGCLGIPYAFARAGFVLCICILLVVTCFSYMTVMWVAETGARYEASVRRQSMDKQDVTHESSNLMRAPSQDASDTVRYEVIDLITYYLGPIHTVLYQVSLVFLMYVGLLAYTQVFCGAISALIWSDGEVPFGLSQLIFGIMVIPLSCMELDEQVSIQSLMATARFVAIFVMVAGSVLALLVDDSEDRKNAMEDPADRPPYFAPAEEDGCHMSYTACFSGFGVAFSTAIFSQLFQHSVPGLLRPLRNQSELVGKAPRVFGASLLTTCSFYLLLGSTGASYFGADTKSSVNLNFANFYFGFNVETTPVWALHLLQLASSFIVIFPALDTISVFPLIANTLGNNLFAATSPSFLKWIARHLAPLPYSHSRSLPPSRSSASVSFTPTTKSRAYSDLDLDVRKSLLHRASHISTILWRLVAAIPPLVGSIWATDLSFSLLLSGIAGLYVAFFAPSLLHICSRRHMVSVGVDDVRNIFSGWYSPTILTYPVIGFAFFALYMVVSQVDDAWQAMNRRD